jgi:cellulose biosynthesis protein BcsQ
MPARTVALYNLKGNSGKTTLATSTAAAAARAGAQVVVFDADPNRDALRVIDDWPGVTAQKWEPGLVAAVDGRADLVLIDCPPDRAAAAGPVADAELVVVPVLPEPLQLRRLAGLLPDLPPHHVVVVNGYYRGAVTDATVARLTELMGDRLWRPPIPRRAAFPRSQDMMIPPQELRGRPVDVVEATAALAAKMLTWVPTN